MLTCFLSSVVAQLPFAEAEWGASPAHLHDASRRLRTASRQLQTKSRAGNNHPSMHLLNGASTKFMRLTVRRRRLTDEGPVPRTVSPLERVTIRVPTGRLGRCRFDGGADLLPGIEVPARRASARSTLTMSQQHVMTIVTLANKLVFVRYLTIYHATPAHCHLLFHI